MTRRVRKRMVRKRIRMYDEGQHRKKTRTEVLGEKLFPVDRRPGNLLWLLLLLLQDLRRIALRGMDVRAEVSLLLLRRGRLLLSLLELVIRR